VEKVGGCNLVVCPCGQAFCWLCGKSTGRAHDWNNIQGHSCGAFREEAESKATESQRSLNRWLHYLTRYDGHLKSMRLEERAREDLDAKVEAMMSQSSSLTNFSWLFQSGRQLFRARRVLAHSYVFAFFVFGPSFKDEFTPQSASSIQALFEDKQAMLEGEVERLAELFENMTAKRVDETERSSIVNAASTINARIVKLYDVIENDIAPQVAGRSMTVAPYRTEGAVATAAIDGGGGTASGSGAAVGGGGWRRSTSVEPALAPRRSVEGADRVIVASAPIQKRARQR